MIETTASFTHTALRAPTGAAKSCPRVVHICRAAAPDKGDAPCIPAVGLGCGQRVDSGARIRDRPAFSTPNGPDHPRPRVTTRGRSQASGHMIERTTIVTERGGTHLPAWGATRPIRPHDTPLPPAPSLLGPLTAPRIARPHAKNALRGRSRNAHHDQSRILGLAIDFYLCYTYPMLILSTA
jgi:hypothetical protein